MEYRDIIKPLYGIDAFRGCGEEETAVIRDRFGTIPAAVEDFYRIAGTEVFRSGQDDWMLPEQYRKWTWLEDIDALVLLNENQGVCQACIRREDLSKADPPVYVTYDDGKTWSLCAPSATEFFAAALAYEAAFTFRYEPEAFFWYTPEEKEEIASRLDKLPFSLLNWCSEMEITFYQNAPDNLLVLMSFRGEDESQALYGAVTGESYERLLAVVGEKGEEV